MKDDLPPPFRDTKQPEPPQLFEELPAEAPEPPRDVPPSEESPRASDPFLRRT
jgi:hypothetical protein